MHKKLRVTRRKSIYDFIGKLTGNLSYDDFFEKGKVGFDATEIARNLNMDRSNTSRELNILVKEDRIIKILGKPVLYVQKDALEQMLHKRIDKVVFVDKEELKKHLRNCLHTYPEDKRIKDVNKGSPNNIFDSIIGAKYSLKNPVKQAIAAIVYPPQGLHTLLIGPTGVGKTTFAEIMYRYAIEIGRLKSDSPYIVFNCADYAGNSQLLLSYLFGHVKGAFTGADRDKKGLIDSADGGILFLDEVHRLPPEGQEMLFSLIDRGKFRRLGESNSIHKARVLIIAATTEDPDKTILKTFLRRIPCVIKLPGLSEKPIKERMELICSFFKEESKKIKLPVTVTTEVLKLFLLYNCTGNIGQLRNDIQLACANAFVEYITENKNKIYVKLSQMTDRFKEGIFTLNGKREEIIKNFDIDAFGDLTFDGVNSQIDSNLEKILIHDDYRTEEDFYESILNNSREYFEQGKSIQQIKKTINSQVRKYFNEHYQSKNELTGKQQESILFKIVPKKIVNIVSEILRDVSKDLEISIDQKVVYSLALHIETLIERIKSGGQYVRAAPSSMDSAKLIDEYKIAEKIKNRLEKGLDIKIPEEEAAFMSMFLYALKTSNGQNYIGVLVLAHGDSTASSMAKVANELLEINHVRAIDMPLKANVNDILSKAENMVERIDNKKGVLLLVDMGSLTTFSEIITEKTGIPTRTVKMVSTPMVIEAARKSMMPNMKLDLLVEEVNSASTFIGQGIEIERESKSEQNNDLKMEADYFSFDEDRMMNLLEEVLTFLNPRKAYILLSQVYAEILKKLNIQDDKGLKIKFIFHCISMLERVIKGEPLQYRKLSSLKENGQHTFLILKSSFQIVENAFGIMIPDSEFAYIVEMLNIYK
ncbi:MAG: sigma 54-interacting transcriptional regulator [Clostridium sp.]|uniref:sigma-54-dependent transcriptional regulator n=1 Tax=Clostridium sp. TaxID=1506 RepID=UPI0025C3ABF9|nr:sigma-54-dependent transcriptional regulator [Clostridium sp.]MCH3965115.1 sigma 54-interacting transcriptional regulator [Clostridium sp.]MCI1714336.1 sigma 54-interacting transcriptional regulator [Clostridium sp.]MCI1798598.1 sigma 54-interacting transcriptional regulator [Clostridium sp.]MCI1812671.1 sigma 54-interacting transcriptional regulator [Clostridium sp.]MCI1869407.1 sigma 54-interacting transcriptional regulator [Clostridium sp.]